MALTGTADAASVGMGNFREIQLTKVKKAHGNEK